MEPLLGQTVIMSAWEKTSIEKSTPIVVELDRKMMNKSIFFSDKDVVAVRIGRFAKKSTPPRNVKLEEGDHPFSTMPQSFTLFDEVKATEEVILVGHPSSLNNYVPADEQLYDELEPLYRRGIVAGKNRKKRMLVIDTSVFPGNSGGPVFLRRTTASEWEISVVGIATQLVPIISVSKNERGVPTNMNVDNAAYAGVIPTDAIMELLAVADGKE